VRAVLQSLVSSGYDAVAIDAKDRLSKKLKKEKIERPSSSSTEMGRGRHRPGSSREHGIPYTGPGVLGSSVAMDKTVMKFILEATGIPTPAYVIAEEGTKVTLRPPVVVKPANEGSTIGISMVHRRKDLPAALALARKYDRKVVVEEFVSGQEITVAVVNGRALPVVEVRPLSGFYDFESKYTKGKRSTSSPARYRGRRRRPWAIAMDVYRRFEPLRVRADRHHRKGRTAPCHRHQPRPGHDGDLPRPQGWACQGGSFG
jgi:D-alanine-D-alanine ligase